MVSSSTPPPLPLAWLKAMVLFQSCAGRRVRRPAPVVAELPDTVLLKSSMRVSCGGGGSPQMLNTALKMSPPLPSALLPEIVEPLIEATPRT